jgi:hypothetical protein
MATIYAHGVEQIVNTKTDVAPTTRTGDGFVYICTHFIKELVPLWFSISTLREHMPTASICVITNLDCQAADDSLARLQAEFGNIQIHHTPLPLHEHNDLRAGVGALENTPFARTVLVANLMQFRADVTNLFNRLNGYNLGLVPNRRRAQFCETRGDLPAGATAALATADGPADANFFLHAGMHDDEAAPIMLYDDSVSTFAFFKDWGDAVVAKDSFVGHRHPAMVPLTSPADAALQSNGVVLRALPRVYCTWPVTIDGNGSVVSWDPTVPASVKIFRAGGIHAQTLATTLQEEKLEAAEAESVLCGVGGYIRGRGTIF